ncbi:MAG: precorrin-6y C5,15-methyltransferase (decarboxylating) subunit CbiE [Rikenellaceae bacterium]
MAIHLDIIGIDDSSIPSLSDQVKGIIARGRIFSGGARHHQIVRAMLPEGSEWINIVPPMESLMESYRGHTHIVVFASGDPLFFGFAQSVQRLLPDARITTYPHFNSLQQLAHRISMPYQHMHNVSLTGRAWDRFDEALICGYETIGVLTDRRDHTPQRIAQRMVEYGYTNYSVTVGELLGNDKERISTISPEEVVGREFAYPNNIILRRKSRRERHFGIADNLFELLDGRERMITKMPIRLATLSQLSLHSAQTFWDIGFCTGSVSIEAKLQFPHLRVEAFEIREGCDAIIEENMRRFGTPGINYRIGDFTKLDLSVLNIPRPDAIFIGGHGGHLGQIVDNVSPLLRPGGAVVFNSVSQQSHDDFIDAATRCGLQIVNRISIKVDEYNPITIIKAVK